MKKILFILVLLNGSFAFGKKVKFAVDMSGQIINPLGIHVTGDFQTAAGFAGGNWTSATLMAQEISDTKIYSIIVDIPAFARYEYKFMNGDQFYEAEFVPLESRVGYNFNDNRWIYVDSLANDTTFVGAIRFGGNAPMNKKLVRFYVDMVNEVVSSAVPHVAGDFQGWNTLNTILYNFDSTSVYEMICYVDSLSTYSYRFYNGNAISDSENVPVVCAVNSNRQFTSFNDTMMSIVCFSACGACVTTAMPTSFHLSAFDFQLFPNPSSSHVELLMNESIEDAEVVVTDYSGRMVKRFISDAEKSIQIERNGLVSGVYFVSVKSAGTTLLTKKWIVE